MEVQIVLKFFYILVTSKCSIYVSLYILMIRYKNTQKLAPEESHPRKQIRIPQKIFIISISNFLKCPLMTQHESLRQQPHPRL